MTIDETIWKTIIEKFQITNPRLHAILKSVSIKDQNDMSVTLVSPSPFHTLQLRQTIAGIEAAIEEVTGKNVSLHLAEQPKVFPKHSRRINPPKLSDREIDEIASTYLTPLEQDIDKRYT